MLAVSSAIERFRGVLCRHCGKPVRVPGIVLRKDSESQGHSNNEVGDSHFQLISRVFVLRCRSCQKEGIYAMNQITDCTAAPPVERAGREHAAH